MQGIGSIGTGPLEDGAQKVVLQDQTTPPLLGYLYKYVSSFSLSTPTIASEKFVLYNTADLEVDHGLIVGDEIIFIDAAADRTMYTRVTDVATNTITIDRPFDHVFPITSTCYKITTDMNVDGSVTPQIFCFNGGATPADVYGINIFMNSSLSPDDGKFGGIAALTNGVVLRVIDGYSRVLGVARTNGEMRSFGTSGEIYSDRGAAGSYGTNVYLPVREQWGVPIRLSNGGCLQCIVQDDLTGLLTARISIVGQFTRGEAMV